LPELKGIREAVSQEISNAAKRSFVTRVKNKATKTRLEAAHKAKGQVESLYPETRGLADIVSKEMVARLAEIEEPLTVEIFERILAEIIKQRLPKEATPEQIILARLQVAEEGGFFDQEAFSVAEEYDMEIHDVYDLWFYPNEA